MCSQRGIKRKVDKQKMKYRNKYKLSGGVEGRMDIEEGSKGKLVLVALQILPSWVTLARCTTVKYTSNFRTVYHSVPQCTVVPHCSWQCTAPNTSFVGHFSTP